MVSTNWSGNIIHTKQTVERKNHKGSKGIAKCSNCYCLKSLLGDVYQRQLFALVSSLGLVVCSDPHTLVAYEGWFGTRVA